MAGTDQSVFSEILQLGIDTSQFEADLGQVEAVWNASLQRMGAAAQSSGVNPSNIIGDTSGIESAIGELTGQLQGLTTTVGASYEALSQVILESMAKAEVAIEGVTAATEKMEVANAGAGASIGSMTNSMGVATARMAASEAGAGRLGYALGLAARAVPALSEALSIAFVPIGIIAVVQVVSSFIDMITKAKDKVSEAGAQWDSFGESASHSADAMQLQNMKLEDQISILQGGPKKNLLSEAILESKMAADQLSKSLDGDIQRANKLIEQFSVGFFQGLLTGKATTGSVIDNDALKSANMDLENVIGKADNAYDAAANKELEAQKTGDKQKIDEAKKTADQMRQIAAKEVQDEVNKVGELIKSYQRNIDAKKKAAMELPDIDDPTTGTFQQHSTKAQADETYAPQTKELSALQTVLDSVTQRYKTLNQQIDLNETKAKLTPTQKQQKPEQFTQWRQEFEGDVSAMSAAVQKHVETVKAAMKDSQTSVAQGESEIVDALTREQAAVNSVVAAWQKKAQDMMKVNPAGAQQILTDLAKFQTDFNAKIDKQITDAKAKAGQDQLKQQEDISKRRIQIAQADMQEELSLTKQAAQQGLTTKTAALDQEVAVARAVHDQKMELLQDEFSQTASGTDAQLKVIDKMYIEQDKYTNQLKSFSAQRVEAIKAETKAIEEQAQQVANLAAHQAQTEYQGAKASGVTGGDLYQLQVSAAQAELDKAVQAAKNALEQWQQALRDSNGQMTPEVQKAADTLANMSLAAQDAADNLGRVTASTKLDNGLDGIQGMTATVKNLNQVFTTLESTVRSVTSAYNQNGALGAIGAGASGLGNIFSQAGTPDSGMNKLFSSIFGDSSGFMSAVPMIGAGLGLIGGIVNAISGIFTATARKVAAQVEDMFSQIMQSYRAGNATLTQTINQLYAERQQAINQLSGEKGGNAQLQKILPQFDQQISQLEQQAQQTRQSFDDMAASLGNAVTMGSEFGQWTSDWINILKQAKDALGAGLGPYRVAQTLNFEKDSLLSGFQDQLVQGQASAVSDALSLNSLLDQRVKILDEINKIEAKSQDSIERRQPEAIAAVQAANDQKKALQDQLDAINQQITLTQQKVAHERTIFAIASDTASLQNQSNALQLMQLDQQLDKYRQMQQIINSMAGVMAQWNPATGTVSFGGATTGQSYGFGGFPGITATPNATPGAIASAPTTININLNNPVNDPVGTAQTIAQELGWTSRAGGYTTVGLRTL